jgi:hypothetical protein
MLRLATKYATSGLFLLGWGLAACSGAGGDVPPPVQEIANPVDPGWNASLCPPESEARGWKIGDTLPPLTLKDCDGQPYELNQLCGAQEMWLYAIHGWCSHCRVTSSEAEAIHDSFVGRGLVSVQVLVQTTSGGIPTAQDCQQWRKQYKHQDVITLYDDQLALKPLWDQSLTSLHVFVDRQQKIRGKLYSSNRGRIAEEIEKVLGSP